MAFLDRHGHCAKRNISVMLLMEGNHGSVVHAVDVVPGQHQHVVGPAVHDEIQVLVNRVGSPLLPCRLLTSYEGLEEANAALPPVQVPRLADTDMHLERLWA